MAAAGLGRHDSPSRSVGPGVRATSPPRGRDSFASNEDRALHFTGEESETVSIDYQGPEMYRSASVWSAAAGGSMTSAVVVGAAAAGSSSKEVFGGASLATRSKDLGRVARNTSKESVQSAVNLDTSRDISRLRLRPSATFIAMTPMRIGRYMSEMSDSSIVLGSASMILLPSTFKIPKSIVRRAIRYIDRTDLSSSFTAPTATGIRMGHVLAALRRFQKAFSNDRDHDRRQSIQLVDDLGFTQPVKYVDLEMTIEWSRDWDCVYNKFSVNLTRLERMYFTLDMAENSTISSKLVSLLLFLAVVASLVVWIVGTLEGLRVVPEGCVPSTINSCMPGPPMWMDTIESICIWIFTLEILMRLVSVGGARRELLNQHYLINLISGSLEDEQMQTPRSCVARVSTFLVSPSFIFDFLSVVPYWVERFVASEDQQIEELSVLQVLYLARVTRVFKLGRALNADLGHFNEVYDLFRTVVMNASPAMIMTGLLIILALFFFGTCIWYCEKGEWVMRSDTRYKELFVVDPGYDGAWVRKSRDGVQDEISPFGSIPSAFWWAIVTVTTVGYGDQVPYTAEGKAVGAFAMLYGTVILGLPLFVVGATFGQEYDRLMKAEKRRQETMNANGSDGAGAKRLETAVNQDQVIEHFVDACKDFHETLEQNVSKLGIPPEVAFNWLEALRVAVTERRPSVALDHLSVRILAYLAEIEESCGRPATHSYRGRRLLSCRKIRFSWHKVCASCCQLASAPHALLLRAFHEGLTSEFDIRSGSKRSVDDAGTSNRCSAPSHISTNVSFRPDEEEDHRHGGELYRAATFNPRAAHTPSYSAVSEDQATAI